MLVAVVRTDEAESVDQPVYAWLAEQAVRRAYTTVRLPRLAERDRGRGLDFRGRRLCEPEDESGVAV